MALDQLSDNSFQERNFGFPLDELTQKEFINFVFGDFRGHLCVSVKNKNDKMWNVFYKKSKLNIMYKYLSNVYGNDVYISYSTYYRGNKNQGARRIQDNLEKTYMLVQDLDYYKYGISDSKFLQGIQKKIENDELLMPNLLLSTGRGYQLVWAVKGFKNIKGWANDRKWRKIQEYQFDILKEFNSDTVVKNPTAITRLAGTKHRKSGNKVYSFLASSKKYDLNEIIEFYKLDHNQTKKRDVNRLKKNKTLYKSDFNNSSEDVSYIRNSYTLNLARIDDIFTYVRIKNERNESYVGIRNTLALILRFHSLVAKDGDPGAAETDVLDLIGEMDMTETTEEEVLRRSAGAIKHYSNWVKGEWDKDKYVQGGLFYSNERLIELMGIQDDYKLQTQLKTIKTRNKEYHKQRMRIKRNSMSKEEYSTQRQTNKQKAIELKEQGYKQQEIADTLGISLNTVKYYFRKKK